MRVWTKGRPLQVADRSTNLVSNVGRLRPDEIKRLTVDEREVDAKAERDREDFLALLNVRTKGKRRDEVRGQFSLDVG